MTNIILTNKGATSFVEIIPRIKWKIGMENMIWDIQLMKTNGDHINLL